MTEPEDSIEQSISVMTSTCLDRARRGEGEAWETIAGMHRRLIAWWCVKAGIHSHDVEDVVQEVLLAAFNGLREFENRTFRGWLWKIAHHKICDYWASRNREPAAFGGSTIAQVLQQIEAESNAPAGPVSRATQLIFDAVVSAIRGEFSEEQWAVFWAVTVDGHSAQEVASSFGVSRNQVYLAKSRIRRRIRQQFDEYH